MRGKGVVLGFLILFILGQLPLQADAGRMERTLSWQNGLKIGIQVENNDFWTTDAVSEIYFVLTLLEVGTVVDFQALIFEIIVVVETNYTGQITNIDPWNTAGDVARIVAQFNIDKEDVNNAGWDIYVASFFYNFSILVQLDGGDNVRLYTHVYEGTPLSISTFDFIVLWPFPPILLMAAVYWLLYIGLKRFNRRYNGLDSDNSKERTEEKESPGVYPENPEQ